MESVNNSKASSREMQQDHSSRQRRKLTFTITFVVLFSLIIVSIITVFAILKHETEAEGLSANPSKAIRAVCDLNPYYRSCSKSLSDNQIIYPSKKINPSKIFTLSLHAAIKQVNDLISTTQAVLSKAKNPRTLSSLRDCESLFKDSVRLLNKAMEVMDQIDPDENVFKENKSMIKILQAWMRNATENFDRCLIGTEYRGLKTSGDNDEVKMRKTKMKMDWFSRPSVENSLIILMKMDEILELFDPRFESVIATLLLNTRGYVFGIGVFCSQYLVLVILIVLVLRLY